MSEEKEVKKQEDSHEEKKVVHHKKIELTSKIRKNPWILATILLGVLVLVLFSAMLIGNIGPGKILSKEKAADQLLNFYTQMGVDNLTLSSVKEVSGLYEVNLIYKGEEIPLYITKDGKNAIESVTPIGPTVTEVTSTGEVKGETITKSEKPVVELYVMSFCPYGVRAENNIFSLIDLFGDKIDFKIRFIVNVNGDTIEEVDSLHGIEEAKEDARQLIILNDYPTKFLTYLKSFNEECYQYSGDATSLETCWKDVASGLGMDTAKIASAAYGSRGISLLKAEETASSKYGVSGSPTLIINGVKSDSIYSGTSATQTSICSAFNTAPEACQVTVNESAQSAPAGSC